MQAQKEPPSDLQCKDKFLLQSVVASPGATPKDMTPEMVKTTNPKKYCVRPNTGIVLPRSTCDITVTMQAQKEPPSDLQCKDKFLLQSVVASPGATPKDITPEMFTKEEGRVVEECKLRVLYVSPPRPPSPVAEGSDEGSSPKTTAMENGNLNGSEVTRMFVDSHENSPEVYQFAYVCYLLLSTLGLTAVMAYLDLYSNSQVRSLISKLTEEKAAAIQQGAKLRQELLLLRRDNSKTGGGVSIMFVIIIGLLGAVLGYLMKRT
ncbi:unnamed protein product [Fraxinus pennsylvanica]|uniref:MSP domain-containing protein n=1 Tax=Fraxinus pennsylvanica TaxID=56036 RepID=A0AAD2DIJ4_9LAMI|nr:unnamed protein product [Fraxinus pennsylvanica]